MKMTGSRNYNWSSNSFSVHIVSRRQETRVLKFYLLSFSLCVDNIFSSTRRVQKKTRNIYQLALDQSSDLQQIAIEVWEGTALVLHRKCWRAGACKPRSCESSVRTLFTKRISSLQHNVTVAEARAGISFINSNKEYYQCIWKSDSCSNPELKLFHWWTEILYFTTDMMRIKYLLLRFARLFWKKFVIVIAVLFCHKIFGFKSIRRFYL